MDINKQESVSIAETNQNVSKIVGEEDSSFSTQNNYQNYEVADSAEVEAISKKLIQQNMEAYKKLAE